MNTNIQELKLFNAEILKQSNELYFHFLSVPSYSDDLKNLFDLSIAQIWNGIDGDEELEIVKLELKNWMESKADDPNKKCGFVAEFLCHSYLIQLEFEQHFLFKNLEETKSMKKGFDGLYQLNEEIWIYESKSSRPTTKSANHNSNISEAFNDIMKKISGKKLDSDQKPIDPWTNAISHASQIQVKTDMTLIQQLNKFKKRFLRNDYEKIKNFNVIPSSTIFQEENWCLIDSTELELKMKRLCKRYEYKKMNVLCINKQSVNDFIRYING